MVRMEAAQSVAALFKSPAAVKCVEFGNLIPQGFPDCVFADQYVLRGRKFYPDNAALGHRSGYFRPFGKILRKPFRYCGIPGIFPHTDAENQTALLDIPVKFIQHADCVCPLLLPDPVRAVSIEHPQVDGVYVKPAGQQSLFLPVEFLFPSEFPCSEHHGGQSAQGRRLAA